MSNALTAISHESEDIGRLVASSKVRHSWKFDVDEESHFITLTVSVNSGKYVVELNGYEQARHTSQGIFTYSFKFRGHIFALRPSVTSEWALSIDSLPFESYTPHAKAAQARALQQYESRRTNQGDTLRHQVESVLGNSSPEPTEEPFSGDLAKRLGKAHAHHHHHHHHRSSYTEQHSDDEGNFLATPLAPVFPDLIDLEPLDAHIAVARAPSGANLQESCVLEPEAMAEPEDTALIEESVPTPAAPAETAGPAEVTSSPVAAPVTPAPKTAVEPTTPITGPSTPLADPNPFLTTIWTRTSDPQA